WCSSAEIGGRLADIEFAESDDGVMASSFVAWPAPAVPVAGWVAVSARGRAHLATRLATRLGRLRDGGRSAVREDAGCRGTHPGPLPGATTAAASRARVRHVSAVPPSRRGPVKGPGRRSGRTAAADER